MSKVLAYVIHTYHLVYALVSARLPPGKQECRNRKDPKGLPQQQPSRSIEKGLWFVLSADQSSGVLPDIIPDMK